jgi:hypothetical protein
LALLRGARLGALFADHYVAEGGILADDPAAHLYWRMLDALAYAPDTDKVAEPGANWGGTTSPGLCSPADWRSISTALRPLRLSRPGTEDAVTCVLFN